MSWSVGSYGFGLLAGMLSTLSPCVLPLLPIVIGSALAAHRFGPAALAVGLALSFVITGLFIATIGFSIGLDGEVLRLAGAILLFGFGLVLLSEALERRFALLTSPMADGMQTLIGWLNPAGLGGQFLIGLLLGIVWLPCVGPVLGAASALAAQRRDLWQVALLMVIFGIGAALPLLLVGVLGRELLQQWRGRLVATGTIGKRLLGAFLVVLAFLIVTGLDRRIETKLVDWSPDWLTALTTRF
jgi:cytochrome c biogenesis protein CcdA